MRKIRDSKQNKGLKALEEARQEGLKALQDLRQEGLKVAEECLSQGLEQGLEQGDRTAREQIAGQLLALINDEQIALTTGLFIEMVQHLRAET